MSVCAIIACWFAGSFFTGAIYVAVNLLAKHRQQQPDEHTQFLGADAGGSFIHHGSVSK